MWRNSLDPNPARRTRMSSPGGVALDALSFARSWIWEPGVEDRRVVVEWLFEIRHPVIVTNYSHLLILYNDWNGTDVTKKWRAHARISWCPISRDCATRDCSSSGWCGFRLCWIRMPCLDRRVQRPYHDRDIERPNSNGDSGNFDCTHLSATRSVSAHRIESHAKSNLHDCSELKLENHQKGRKESAARRVLAIMPDWVIGKWG